MIKQNFKILISILCLLQFAVTLQAGQTVPGQRYNSKNPHVQAQLVRKFEPKKFMPKNRIARVVDVVKEVKYALDSQAIPGTLYNPKNPKIQAKLQPLEPTRAELEQERLGRLAKEAKAQGCKINVFPVRVLGQDHHPWPAGNIPDSAIPWATAAQGEGGNCGYHALKNVTGLIASFDKNGNRDPQGVWALAQFPLYQNFMQRAVPIVAALGVRESLTWLDSGQLEALVDQMESPVPIVIAENVTGFGFADNVLLALRNFAVNSDGALGIIWNAGITHYEARIGAKAAKIQSGGGHWVGFVAV